MIAQQPRSIKDGPWCWQHKQTLRFLRDTFEDQRDHGALAISVYVALSELASDAQGETFTCRISEIAQRACVSYRKTFDLLKRFETVKLIAVERNIIPGTKERSPSTYTLCTPCITLTHGSDGLRAENIEEREESGRKERNTPKRSTPHSPTGNGVALQASPVSRNGRGHSLSLYTGDEREMLRDYHRFIDIRRQQYGEKWFRVNRYSEVVRKALEIRGDPEEFREFLQDALKDEDSIPDRHTLVRLCWQNY